MFAIGDGRTSVPLMVTTMRVSPATAWLPDRIKAGPFCLSLVRSTDDALNLVHDLD